MSATDDVPEIEAPSRYVSIERADWQRLSHTTPLPLTDDDVTRLRGLGDPIDLAEVDAIYRPMTRLLNLYSTAIERMHAATSTFLGENAAGTPYVIGVAGSVAVGKSTTARLLRELMARWPESPHVELMTTDGFLFPNEELQRRGLMGRKGFPESYDRRALLRFVSAVKSGVREVQAPVYDHLRYDIVPDEFVTVKRPDILIIEGLNVLQPPRLDTNRPYSTVAVSDYFDFSIYVDARPTDVRRWYIDRFLSLRSTAFSRPESYFRRYATLSDDEAIQTAGDIWDSINAPNLNENVRPTRSRADLVLRKGADHSVERVYLRRG